MVAPGEIRLFTAAEGVTKQIDTPVYYTTSTAASMSAIDTTSLAAPNSNLCPAAITPSPHIDRFDVLFGEGD